MRMQSSNNDLRSWLKINDLLEHTNDSIIEKYFETILKSIKLNSKKEILLFWVKYSSTKQINDLYNIIKDYNLKEKEESKHQNVEIKLINKSKKTKKSLIPSSYFNEISQHSIANICDFLSRDDITNFKVSCRTICIECLECMSKCLMSIINTNKFINHNIIHNMRNLKFVTYRSYNRYNCNNNTSLFHQIEICNNFPQKYQIPIATKVIDETAYDFEILDFEPIQAYSARSQTSLMLFDKRNITILSGQNHRKMTENDTFNCLQNKMIILYYFDVYRQQMFVVNNIIIDKNVCNKTLINYIKNHLIFTEILNKYNINNTMKNILATNENNIFRICDITNFSKSYDSPIHSRLIYSFVFQLNGDNYPLFWKLENEYNINHLQPFCYRVNFYINKLYKMIQFVPHLENKESLKHIGLKTFQQTICNTITIETIKKHISKRFKSNIPYKNIQLYYQCENKMCLLSKLDVLFTPSIAKIIYFDIVAYDTNLPSLSHLYKIELFSYLELPFPFNMQISNSNAIATKSIKVTLSQKYTVNELVCYLIKLSSNPLFSHYFNDIISSFDNYINSTHPLCYAEISGYLVQSNDVIISNQNEVIDKNIKLYMIPNENDKYKNIKLLIRFAWHSMFNKNTNLNNFKWCIPGLPLIVWIKATDTLQNVINQNQTLQKYKDYICDVYRIAERFNKFYFHAMISEKQRINDKIYESVLKEHPRDFIVITLTN